MTITNNNTHSLSKSFSISTPNSLPRLQTHTHAHTTHHNNTRITHRQQYNTSQHTHTSHHNTHTRFKSQITYEHNHKPNRILNHKSQIIYATLKLPLELQQSVTSLSNLGITRLKHNSHWLHHLSRFRESSHSLCHSFRYCPHRCEY